MGGYSIVGSTPCNALQGLGSCGGPHCGHVGIHVCSRTYVLYIHVHMCTYVCI